MSEGNMHKNFYHGSTKRGLKRLEPRVSTHGKSWIYATHLPEIAALFIGPNHDFICGSGIARRTTPYLYERFPGALEEGFGGVSGSIYTLLSDGFMGGKTSWSSEWVHEAAVDIIAEQEIENVLEHILELEKNGKIEIYRYPSMPPNAPEGKEDLIQKAVEKVQRFSLEEALVDVVKYHPDIVQTVIEHYKRAGEVV